MINYIKFALDMSTKKKIIIATIIALPVILLFSMWFVNKLQNEKHYAEDLAVRFDDAMKASYRMLAVTNSALYRKVEFLEQNATEAFKYYPSEYIKAFQYLNEEGVFTNDRLYIRDYMFSLPCYAGWTLRNGSGKLREKESRAVRQIEYARQTLNNPYDMEYVELVECLHDVKKALSESSIELAKYQIECGDFYEWRNFDDLKYRKIFQRYESRKNWPFTFLNRKKY